MLRHDLKEGLVNCAIKLTTPEGTGILNDIVTTGISTVFEQSYPIR